MNIESIKRETNEDIMTSFLEHIASLNDAELKGQLLVTKGAIHALRHLQGIGITIENVEYTIAQLSDQEQMIDDLIKKDDK